MSLPLLLACFFVSTTLAHGQGLDYVNFESGPTRPLALSDDGTRLYVANLPDDRLEIFDVSGQTPIRIDSVPVGIDPVAVALNGNQVWVVNHQSDDVSIVDLSGPHARVVRTLHVGDEPFDIVFAGPPGDPYAFISAAHMGQNNPNDPQLLTPGIERADVWVFDPQALGPGMGGDEVAILSVFSDRPRPLATDGEKVWVGAFHSGNRTTVINESAVCNGGPQAPSCTVQGITMPGGLPAPVVDANGLLGPEVGLIVRQTGAPDGPWLDELGRDWSAAVRFDLPDWDFFEIDATTFPPEVTGRKVPGVGTILFNAVMNPVNGKLYVSNTEAHNEVRFEGHGHNAIFPTVIGKLHESRITVVDPVELGVTPRPLNPHIDYSVVPSPPGTKEASLAMPLEMVVSPDGGKLYVAAYGSSKVGFFATSELEDGTFIPSATNHAEVSGGGPAGLALDPSGALLFVYTRFDNGLSVVDTATRTEIWHDTLPNPEPQFVRDGRPFLYDARKTSSNGDSACADCHVFGGLDSLSWDLGNPDQVLVNNPLPLRIPAISGFQHFHPLKGPMAVQTLKGMDGHGSMHWRGDRNGGSSDPFNEEKAFKAFNGAFPELLGREAPLTAGEMDQFTQFMLATDLPANPVRNLDNSLTAAEAAGESLFFGRVTDTLFNCEGCHKLNPAAGHFGTDGFGTFENETQTMKVAHMRNMYKKVGMFGMSPSSFVDGPFTHMGPQVRGTGYLHDGSVDHLFRFLSAGVFSINDSEQQNLAEFSLAFPSNHAPIVGQQITLTPSSAPEVDTRIDLLLSREAFGECDLIVKGIVAGERRGAVRIASGQFQTDRAGEIAPESHIRNLAATPGQELTYTCVPLGTGVRAGIDRDADGFYDGDERDAGSDPDDPASTPTPAVCGNSIVEPGEQCDDGSANGGTASCCAADCSFKPDGAASCDGVACTKTDTCTAGVCTPGSCATGSACGCGGACGSSSGTCGCVF